MFFGPRCKVVNIPLIMCSFLFSMMGGVAVVFGMIVVHLVAEEISFLPGELSKKECGSPLYAM